MNLRYSDITPGIEAALRIERALEPVYPQGGTRASQILAGWEEWKLKRARGHLRSVVCSGIDQNSLDPAKPMAVGSRS